MDRRRTKYIHLATRYLRPQISSRNVANEQFRMQLDSGGCFSHMRLRLLQRRLTARYVYHDICSTNFANEPRCLPSAWHHKPLHVRCRQCLANLRASVDVDRVQAYSLLRGRRRKVVSSFNLQASTFTYNHLLHRVSKAESEPGECG